jgi:hypothetical protein
MVIAILHPSGLRHVPLPQELTDGHQGGSRKVGVLDVK